eukprot:CAMPEP_0115426258 /NCGR_PEP_ID=MMETSP0271-20121206/28819_1 /TAXON_ID=71861 /ORGANISM="Scrippsiella trochoidea, Strain CCMP3099" /LENGTH=73 /DNA_ID=CAMNT_0002851215 /DNA_START=33 /DNA_END=252 /DNA_ORIENTATION=-
MTATQEFVVPRSMPMMLPALLLKAAERKGFASTQAAAALGARTAAPSTSTWRGAGGRGEARRGEAQRDRGQLE